MGSKGPGGKFLTKAGMPRLLTTNEFAKLPEQEKRQYASVHSEQREMRLRQMAFTDYKHQTLMAEVKNKPVKAEKPIKGNYWLKNEHYKRHNEIIGIIRSRIATTRYKATLAWVKLSERAVQLGIKPDELISKINSVHGTRIVYDSVEEYVKTVLGS